MRKLNHLRPMAPRPRRSTGGAPWRGTTPFNVACDGPGGRQQFRLDVNVRDVNLEALLQKADELDHAK